MKKQLNLFFLLGMLVFPAIGYPQGEANIWYFGGTAGLDFNSGNPVPLINGQASTLEGTASVSDASGNLLFYTDGLTVWDKTHSIMPNGTGLMGGSSTTQSALIIKKPGSNTHYYIFTAASDAFINGFRYSEVDITLNTGNGDVIAATKNTLLHGPSCEKITAVKHCNRRDVWVVSHDWGNDTFRTVLVTPAGINPIHILSKAGLSAVTFNSNSCALGYMKASPDGKKLASAMMAGAATPPATADKHEVFDFDNTSGIVSGGIILPEHYSNGERAVYGVEFSPDGTRLYCTAAFGNTIRQYNMCAPDSATMVASDIIIGTTTPTNREDGALQNGPDGKIYVAKSGQSFMGVINNPNVLGVGCGFTGASVSLGGKFAYLGLPNFPPYFFDPSQYPLPPVTFGASTTCLSAGFTAPVLTATITSCSGPTQVNIVNSYEWNFGDPSSGSTNTTTTVNPIHMFSAPGTYSVQLVLFYQCYSDTVIRVLNSSVPIATLTATDASCNGENSGSIAVNTSGGAGGYTYSWNNGSSGILVTGLSAGTYTVTVIDSDGCTQMQTGNITEPLALSVSTLSVNASCGANNGIATVYPSGGSGSYTYSWSASVGGQTTSSISNLATGVYTVTVTDSNHCTTDTSVSINNAGGPLLFVQSQNHVNCKGGNDGSVSVTASGGSLPYIYNWSNGQSGATATGLAAGAYSVTVSDGNSCTTLQTLIITEPSVPSVIISQTACNSYIHNAQTYTVSGVYTQTLTNAQNCDSTLTINLTINNAIITTGNESICEGEMISIHGTNQSTAGIYTQTFTTANCDSISSITLTIYPGPAITAMNDTTILSGNNITLTATGGASYLWNTGETTSTVNHQPVSSSIYTVILTDANGCTATDSVKVFVSESICQDEEIFIPSAFSPNGDGYNDVLQLFITNTSTLTGRTWVAVYFAIYNRWGEKVFETENLQKSWDGTYRNKPADTAVFTWVLKFTCKGATSETIKTGNTSLMR